MTQGFPGAASDKEPTCHCRRHETWIQYLGWEDPLQEGLETHSSFLAWRILWAETPGWATVHEVAKNQTRLNIHACHMTEIKTVRGKEQEIMLER